MTLKVRKTYDTIWLYLKGAHLSVNSKEKQGEALFFQDGGKEGKSQNTWEAAKQAESSGFCIIDSREISLDYFKDNKVMEFIFFT